MAPLPYASHPLYNIRKASILLATAGILVILLTISPGHPALPVAVLSLGISVIFSATDVLCYATKKAKHPDQDPPWPSRGWMLGDVVLALGLQYAFWQAQTLLWLRPYDVVQPFADYGNLATLICSILHAWAFWRELMARYKQAWLATLPKFQCPECGYMDQASETPISSEALPFLQRDAVHPETPRRPTRHPGSHHISPLPAKVSPVDVRTPTSSDSAMEEGLLIGSDFGGYGSVSHHELEPTLDQPEEVIVRGGSSRGHGKGKGKKRREES